MAETPTGTVFREKHPPNTRYRLTYTNRAGNALWWNGDEMEWTLNASAATLYHWDDLEKAGNIAKRYAPGEINIDPYTLIL